MTDPAAIAAEARRVDELYRAKARAEIGEAEKAARATGSVRGRGDELAEVLLVKGEPGPEDLRMKRALSGADGPAIGKALDALGLSVSRYAFCSAAAGSRDAVLRRVRLLVEAIDPRIIVTLDAVAARDLAEAYGAGALRFGERQMIGGRTVVAVDGFEESLGNVAAKRRAWRQLQALSGDDI